MDIREWSLIKGAEEGGLHNGRGRGQLKLYPFKKGGGKTFRHAKVGSHKVLR